MHIISTEQIAQVRSTAVDRVVAEVPTYRTPWECARVRRTPAAVVLPWDYHQGYVLLARQPRIGALGAVMLEAPAGKLDPGEAPQAAARRELEEELGVRADSWTPVAAGAYASPGYSAEQMWLFLAEGLTRGAARQADGYITPVTVLLAELDDLLQRYAWAVRAHDPHHDLKTLTLLLALRLRLAGDPRVEPQF